MAAFAAMAGLGLTAAGTGMQFMGMQAQKKAQQAETNLEIFGQKQRQQAMELDATRRTRETLRQSFIARGAAENKSAGEGTQYGSMLPGIEGGIANQTAYNLEGISQNLALGREIAQTNEGISRAKMAYAEAGSDVAMGAGLVNLGGAFTKNIDGFSRLQKEWGMGV